MAMQRLTRRQHRQVVEAVEAAEKKTGLQFCVYLGPTEEDVRAHAETLFTEPLHLVAAGDLAPRTLAASLADVVAAFEGFASGDPAWKDSFSWGHL